MIISVFVGYRNVNRSLWKDKVNDPFVESRKTVRSGTRVGMCHFFPLRKRLFNLSYKLNIVFFSSSVSIDIFMAKL